MRRFHMHPPDTLTHCKVDRTVVIENMLMGTVFVIFDVNCVGCIGFDA